MLSSFVVEGSVVVSSGALQKTNPTRVVLLPLRSAGLTLTQHPSHSGSTASPSKLRPTVSLSSSPAVAHRRDGCDVDYVDGNPVYRSPFYGDSAYLLTLPGGDASVLVQESASAAVAVAASAARATATATAVAGSSTTRKRTKQLPRRRRCEGGGIQSSALFSSLQKDKKRRADEQSLEKEKAASFAHMYDDDDDDDDDDDMDYDDSSDEDKEESSVEHSAKVNSDEAHTAESGAYNILF